MPLSIVRSDIIGMRTNAIVNAANNALQKGGGVCGAIFAAAGEAELQSACNKIGRCETGQAVITSGFALQSDFIIHTVGPVWRGGGHGERELLYACYKNALELARSYYCESIAFPLISSGIFGYPNDKALSVAVKAIGDFLRRNDMSVSLVIYGDTAFSLGGNLHSSLQAFIGSGDAKPLYEQISQSEFEALRDAAAPFMPPAETRSPGLFDISDLRSERQRAAFTSDGERPRVEEQRSSQRRLEDVVGNISETFSQMLMRLIDERNLTDASVWRRANVDKSVFSRIRSKKDYRASKITVLSFAIALELSLDETIDLLGRAGFALSPSSKQDLIVKYFISEGIYDIFQINETLFLYNQGLIGV